MYILIKLINEYIVYIDNVNLTFCRFCVNTITIIMGALNQASVT